MKQAEKGLSDLAAAVDTVISIPNDKLLTLVPKATGFYQAFRVADDVLRQAVQGIAEIITTPGIINRDFSDIRALMLGAGFAMMGSASAKGENALVEAAKQAITGSLVEEGGVKGARGILINITGSSKLGLHEVNDACALIRAAAEYEDVQINFGIVLDEALEDTVKITVIATGFQRAGHSSDRSSVSEQVMERATEPRFAPEPASAMSFAATSYPEPEPVAGAVDPYADMEPALVEEATEEIAVAASANVPALAAIPTAPSEEAKNDLDLPAFMRRERRLFQ
jgi:cell division protein FtsZ